MLVAPEERSPGWNATCSDSAKLRMKTIRIQASSMGRRSNPALEPEVVFSRKMATLAVWTNAMTPNGIASVLRVTRDGRAARIRFMPMASRDWLLCP